MEEDDEIQSPASGGSRSPASTRQNGRITVTVAVPPAQVPASTPTQNKILTLALPSSAQQQGRSSGGGREDCWSEGATAVLIEAWGERYLELSRGNLKQKHWKEVADVVSSRENYGKIPKTDIQCKNRIDTVKKKYKLEKSKIGAGGGPSKWPFYERLDHLIGPSGAKVGPGSAGGGGSGVFSGHSKKMPVGLRHSQFLGRRAKLEGKIRQRDLVESDSDESREPSPISIDNEIFERKRRTATANANANANASVTKGVGGGSYSLTLLVIFHFQTCSPAILPPLKDIYPGNIIDDLRGLRVDTERHIAETCDANIKRIKRAYNMSPGNRSSLSELFVSFLGKFSDISMRASGFGICTYTGQWHAIESYTRWLPKTYALFIEDPFEQPENSARAVSNRELTRISGTFAMSHHRLISTNHSSFSNMPDQWSLLATLVRPQTSRLIVGPPVRNPVYNPQHRQPTQPQRFRAESSRGRTPTSNNGARKPTHPQVNQLVPSPSQVQPPLVPMVVHSRSQVQPPQVHKLVHSPSQVQPQLQTTEPKWYDNRSTTGRKQYRNRSTTIKPPPQTHQDRPPQMWRPRSDTSVNM